MDTSNVAARSDLAAQFVRVEEWPAARPNFDLRPFVGNMRGMVAACSQPLRALEAAGQALAHDILCFLSARLSEKETTKTVLFVRAAHYEAHTLILDPFFHIRTMASDAIETISDFKQRVCNTEKAVHEVRTCLAKLGIAIKKAGWNLDIQSLTSAASVPTASPYQLRFETLFEREDVVAKLASQKDADLLLSLDNTQLFSLDLNTLQPDTKKSRFGNGWPTMIFVSVYHEQDGRKYILCGCNAPNWKGFPEVAAVTRTMRNHRLHAYLPLSDAAFYKLHALENSFLAASAGEHGKTKKDLLWGARKAAGAAMRVDDTFLGGTHEVGIALRTLDLKPNMACYLCGSMMGYVDPIVWTEDERKAYVLTFK